MCVTEMNEREEIDRLVGTIAGIISDRESPSPSCSSRAARRAEALFIGRRTEERVEGAIPAALLRDEIAGFPELGELEVLRHFTRLSQRNFAIESQFYPLGSCTMKYNPKINEVVARFPGFAQIHPMAAAETCCRALWRCFTSSKRMLAEISGMEHVSSAAVRRRARRAHRFDADSRLSRGTRQSAQEYHRARHGARHQSGELDAVRLRRGANFFQ